MGYQRSVLHRAALAVPSLPPPKEGSLRHVALACVQQLQGAAASPVSTQSANKRPLPDSPNAPSPSHLPPLAQRIRSDFQIGEGEVESPERELLRSQLDPESFSPLISPHCVQGVPPPAPLVFTPQKSHERSEMPANTAEEVSAEKVAALEGSVVICDEKKRNTEQIEEEFEEESEEESKVEFEEEKKRRIEKLERLIRLR